MEWRTIPGFEAYEVSQDGTVRKRDSGNRLRVVGRKVRLWDGVGGFYTSVDSLVARAFGQPETAVAAAPVPPVHADAPRLREHPKASAPRPAPRSPADPVAEALVLIELEQLRLKVASLEHINAELIAELSVYRVDI
jgi:hypothetical protein